MFKTLFIVKMFKIPLTLPHLLTKIRVTLQ